MFLICMCMSVFLFVACSWSSSLSSPTYPPVYPSIHQQLMHYPVQLRPGPNLASRPYLCTVSYAWRLTVMQVLFFISWLCCCLTFLALRGALVLHSSHIICQCEILKVNVTRALQIRSLLLNKLSAVSAGFDQFWILVASVKVQC